MGRVCPPWGIICVFLIIWTEKTQCPVNPQPESNICVLQTRKGLDIRVTLEPSFGAQSNIHRTLDLSNARCCLNPDKKFALPRHLNITLNNITPLVKYPIHPTWMVVNNKRIPHLGVWDELWYSLYEFGKPSLVQSVDVVITSKTPFNTTEVFSSHLHSDNSFATSMQTETTARLVVSPHRPPVGEEGRIMIEDVFLLVPEVTDDLKKDSQTRRGPRDYLVLHQSLFGFPNSDCFNEKTRFMSLVNRKHRPCVEASSVDLHKQPYDFYVKAKVKENDEEPTEFFLSSFGSLHNPETNSRDRSFVAFISPQPLILHIFIPNEDTSSRLTIARILDTVSLYSRHLGSFLKDQCSQVLNAIREAYGIIFEYSCALYSCHIEPFLNDQCTIAASRIRDGYDIIVQHLRLLSTFLEALYSSAADVLYSAADQLCDQLVDIFDRISLEKSIDYQWNLIRSYVNDVCQKINVMRADVDARIATGWIAFSALCVFPVLLVKWLVTSLTNSAGLEETDDIIILDNDSGTFVFGRDDLLTDFLQDGFNMMYLPPWTDEDDIVDDDTNTTMVGQDKVQQSASGISLTASDLSLSMAIACDTKDFSLLRQTVSDPCVRYDSETATFDNNCKALCIYRCSSDSAVMYRGRRGIEIRSLKTSRDLSLVTEATFEENCRSPPRQSFSAPCICPRTAVEEYQNDGANDFIFRNYSSYHLMPVTFRESTTRVVGSSMGNLTSALKLFKEEPFEEEQADAYLDDTEQLQGYKLNEDARKELKGLIAEEDQDYGNDSTPRGPSTHLTNEELFQKNEGTYLETYKTSITENSSDSEQSEEYKLEEGVKKALKGLIAEVDNDYGNDNTPRRPSTHLIDEEPLGEDEGTDLDVAYKVCKAQKGTVLEVSPKDEDFKKAVKDFLKDIDETYGNPTPGRRFRHFLWQAQEVMFYVLRVYMDNRFY